MSNNKTYLKALLLGLLFPIAFSPFNQLGWMLISLCGLFVILFNDSQTGKQAALIGLWFGLGKYGFGLSWVVNSLINFSDVPLALAFFITFGFILIMSLYDSLAALIFYKLKQGRLLSCLLFAAVFTTSEYLRGHLFTGMPWLFTGDAFTIFPLGQLAAIIGRLGLSFLGLLISAWLANCLFIKQRHASHNYLYALLVIAIIGLSPLLTVPSYTTEIVKPLNVALAQGNIYHDDKWQNNSVSQIVSTYTQLSNQARSADLIIWPETALPVPSIYALDIFEQLKKTSGSHHRDYLIGMPGSNRDGSLSNSLLLVGEHSQRYDKQHLVPFGEYMPLPILHPLYQQLNIPFSDLTIGHHGKTLFNSHGVMVAPFICFEVAFNDENYQAKLKDSNLIITVTDDSWFGHSLAKAQHLQIAQMRSIESQKPQLFVSNNGLSSIINKKGGIDRQLTSAKQGILTGQVKAATGHTPIVIWGEWPLILFCLIFIMLLVVAAIKKKAYAMRICVKK